jgi:hypothetical protein
VTRPSLPAAFLARLRKRITAPTPASRPFSIARGEEFVVPCENVSDDTVRLRTITRSDRPSVVAIAAANDEEGCVNSIHLSPAKARLVAAALLNMADELDGTEPLVFLPEASR